MAEAAKTETPKGNGTEAPPRFSIRDFLAARRQTLLELAGGMIDPDKLIKTVAFMARANDGRLYAAAEKDPEGFFLALCKLTEAGLEPDGVEAALIPYGDQVQAQAMFQGLVKLLYSSGLVRDVYAKVVYAEEVAQGRFDVSAGTNPGILHKPLLVDRGDAIAAYAVIHLQTGGLLFDVMTKEEIEQRRAFSQSWANERTRANSPWSKWPDEQWKKTVLKRAAKTAPKSESLKRALAIDNDDVVETEVVSREEAPPRAGTSGLKATLGQLAAPTPKEKLEPAAPKATVAAKAPPKEEKKAAPAPAAAKAQGKPAPAATDDDEPPRAPGPGEDDGSVPYEPPESTEDLFPGDRR